MLSLRWDSRDVIRLMTVRATSRANPEKHAKKPVIHHDGSFWTALTVSKTIWVISMRNQETGGISRE